MTHVPAPLMSIALLHFIRRLRKGCPSPSSRTRMVDASNRANRATTTTRAEPLHRGVAGVARCFIVRIGFLLLANVAAAQDWQFLFDARGNLIVQTAESSALPQILGQPPNQIVAPGEAASFFVLLADTRA